MADTIPDIFINSEWQSIEALTGIATGLAINIQNKTRINRRIILAQGPQPAADSVDGAVLDQRNNVASLEVGQGEVWARTYTGSCRCHVEEAA